MNQRQRSLEFLWSIKTAIIEPKFTINVINAFFRYKVTMTFLLLSLHVELNNRLRNEWDFKILNALCEINVVAHLFRTYSSKGSVLVPDLIFCLIVLEILICFISQLNTSSISAVNTIRIISKVEMQNIFLP